MHQQDAVFCESVSPMWKLCSNASSILPSEAGLLGGGLDREYHVRQLMLALGLTSDAGESSNHLLSHRRQGFRRRSYSREVFRD